jgi:hypothetical protein
MADSMDQRSNFLFHVIKWLSARVIHNKFVAPLDSNAIVYSMVTKYLRQCQVPVSPIEPPEETLKIVIDDIILDAFDKQLFS